MLFRDPAASDVQTTRMSDERDVAAQVTQAQKRVLLALCRPYQHDPSAAVPATNLEPSCT